MTGLRVWIVVTGRCRTTACVSMRTLSIRKRRRRASLDEKSVGCCQSLHLAFGLFLSHGNGRSRNARNKSLKEFGKFAEKDPGLS